MDAVTAILPFGSSSRSSERAHAVETQSRAEQGDAVATSGLHALSAHEYGLIASHLEPHDIASLTAGSKTLARGLADAEATKKLHAGQFLQKILSATHALGPDHARLDSNRAQDAVVFLHGMAPFHNLVAQKQRSAIYDILVEDHYPRTSLANRLLFAIPLSAHFSPAMQREVLRRAMDFSDVDLHTPETTFEAACNVIGDYPPDAQMLALEAALRPTESGKALTAICKNWPKLASTVRGEICTLRERGVAISASDYAEIVRRLDPEDSKYNSIFLEMALSAAQGGSLELIATCAAVADRFSTVERGRIFDTFAQAPQAQREFFLGDFLRGAASHPADVQAQLAGELRSALSKPNVNFFELRPKFDGLIHALPTLLEASQQRFVGAVACIPSDYLKSEAMTRIASVLPSLAPAAQAESVRIATEIPNIAWRAHALAALNVHSPVLEESLRHELVSATLSLPDDDTSAPKKITALYGMSDAAPQEKAALVNKFLAAGSSLDKSCALVHLGPIMAELSDADQAALMTSVYDAPRSAERTLALESMGELVPQARRDMQMLFMHCVPMLRIQGVKTLLMVVAKHVPDLHPDAQRQYFRLAPAVHGPLEHGRLMAATMQSLEGASEETWQQTLAAIPTPRTPSTLMTVVSQVTSMLGPVLQRRNYGEPAYRDVRDKPAAE